MQMIQCQNCGKLTGFKRNLGFGTIIMIVLTAGFWIFVLPFYPVRCITCGLKRASIPTKSSESNALFAMLALIVVVLIVAFAVVNHTPQTGTSTQGAAQPSAPVTGNDTSHPSSNAIPADNPSPDAPVDSSEKVISVAGVQFRKEYEEDDRAADARYKNRRVLVTGTLTGLAVPSMEEGMKMARKGLEANAVLMMDSPPVPESAFRSGEAMFYPGITAHSKNGSFFGLSGLDARSAIDQWEQHDEMVTLLCTVGDSYHVSELTGSPRSMFGDVNINIGDCTTQRTPPPEEDNGAIAPQYSEEAAMLMYGIIAQKIHPEPLDASFTQPKIIAVDHNDTAAKGEDDSPMKGISGTVILECVVDTDGKCPQWHILKSVDPREDQAVINGLAGVQFQPATEHGRSIAYPFIYKVKLNYTQ
jgi:TonB family protein